MNFKSFYFIHILETRTHKENTNTRTSELKLCYKQQYWNMVSYPALTYASVKQQSMMQGPLKDVYCNN